MSRITVIVAVTLAAALRLGAQDSSRWDVGVQLMQSTSGSAPMAPFEGLALGVRQSAVAVRATTSIVRLGPVSLRYAAQLLPVMRLDGVERATLIPFGDNKRTYVLDGTRTAYGVGIVPFGMEAALRVGRRVRLQGGAGAGIAAFTQSVPYAASRRRNFTAEWDGTLHVDVASGRSVQLGVRWKHISNANTAFENPGIDSRMLFVGMSWSVRAPR